MQKNSVKKVNFYFLFFPAAILACFFIVYWPMFQKMTLRWASDDNNYCYLIVPLFLYLCWEQKDRFRFGDLAFTSWGLIPIMFAIALIILGELGSVETLAYIGIWGCIVGLTIVLYGWRTRFLIFPLIILFFIVPLPAFINTMLTFDLKMAASTLSTLMLRH